MEAGKLRHYVHIQKPVRSETAYGVSDDPTWQTVTQAYAEIRPLRAAEAIRAGQTEAETTYLIRMRYESCVKPESRIVWYPDSTLSNARKFHISSIINVDMRNIELQLICHERVNDAD